ncbi:deoxyuridine 5'-triphosphate nucleotidohydrolase [Basidiobolus meristosporus CBS 931.73]|uniref:Deoxyuridine 5'-triphosphate nucleotidohydrolase n=1 Tax=Basidiobolus meristosporus CBS 931.73 TaxID=1314790 RepID=A0A1Y1Y8R0_9FUNG|nr:deoxyuridine 5'-triphosphate nucleotidohydrolase [Basidiobolus meristosporus CBS 931.73]|eukprot:ORX94126.1 deoxyuridine 5'-triphosphate nucleotidohydrolase [Basidiobolus meristosporus CBS 931.73]
MSLTDIHPNPVVSQTETLENQAPTRVNRLLVKKLSDKARIPVRSSAGAAGYDLFSAEDVVLQPWSRAVVKTDISIHVPHGTYGRVAPRSGLAVKNFIDLGAGVVDEDYRGNLGVVMFNFNKDEPFKIEVGDRIAQLVLEKIATPDIEVVDDLAETVRGAGGFGSTGKN